MIKVAICDDDVPILNEVQEYLNRYRRGRGLGLTQMDPEQLEFCEVIHRTLLFHMISGKVLESTGSLDDLNWQRAMNFWCGSTLSLCIFRCFVCCVSLPENGCGRRGYQHRNSKH